MVKYWGKIIEKIKAGVVSFGRINEVETLTVWRKREVSLAYPKFKVEFGSSLIIV